MQTAQSKGWSPERKAKHAAAIRRWKPWAASTGPKTPEGKARSAGNSRKHGMRSRAAATFFKALAAQQRYVRLMLAHSFSKTYERTIEASLPNPKIMQKSCFFRPPDANS